MLEQVRSYLARYRLLSANDRVVVAVSGGPDSVALVHILHRLAPELDLQLHLYHLHHGLRGRAADGDAEYVAGLADSLGWECTIYRADVAALAAQAGRGVSETGRHLRYAQMAALAAAFGAGRIATGHHRDDQAETVLHRLLRGGGRQALSGIPPVRPAGMGAPPGCSIIRPLLAVGREDIEAYCAAQGLVPRRDATNLDTAYLRNRIRQELIPYLATHYNPAITTRLGDLANILSAEETVLQAITDAAWNKHAVIEASGGVLLPASALTAEPEAIARRLVHRAAAVLGIGLEFQHVARVLSVAAGGAGTTRVTLPQGLVASVEYGAVHLQVAASGLGNRCQIGAVPLRVPGTTDIPAFNVRLETAFIAARPHELPDENMQITLAVNRLPGALAVRARRPGDRIYPVGMTGSKKLQDLMVDLKIPRRRREQMPVLAAGEQVVWVVGVRADRRFIADPAESGLLVRAGWFNPEIPS